MIRSENLFELARLCAAPPPVVDSMAVADFATLIAEMAAVRQAAAASG